MGLLNLTRKSGKFREERRYFKNKKRVDDDLKGGDIDILIISDNDISISQINRVKIDFYKQFGERKIDIVCFNSSDESPFKQLALAEGVEL